GDDLFLNALLPDLAEAPEDAASAADRLLRRHGLWIEALAAPREAVWAARHPDAAEALRRRTLLARQGARKAAQGPGSEGAAYARRLLASWQAELDQLDADLAGRVPELAARRRGRSADRAAVAAALPPGGALVEFVRLPSGGPRAFALPA